LCERASKPLGPIDKGHLKKPSKSLVANHERRFAESPKQFDAKLKLGKHTPTADA
jgi:hypothetical protein